LWPRRKYFKSNEELRGRINPETGDIDVFAVRKVVDSVTNPVREISLGEAREVKPDAQLEEEIEFQKPTVGLAGSQRRWQSRSSFKRFAKRSARAFTRNTTSMSARW